MMPIERSVARIPLGSGQYRRRVVVSAPAPGGKSGMVARQVLQHLAELIATQPGIWLCGDQLPDSIKLVYESERWTVVAEALSTEGDE
jgi:hypothetical protein